MSIYGILKMFSIYIFGNFKPLSHFKKKFPSPPYSLFHKNITSHLLSISKKNLLCQPYSKMEETEWNKNMSECQTKAGNQEHSLTHYLSQHTEQLWFSCLCSKVTVYR